MSGWWVDGPSFNRLSNNSHKETDASYHPASVSVWDQSSKPTIMSIWASNLINSKSKQSTGQFGGALTKLDKTDADVVQDSGVIDKKAYDIITDGSPA